MKHIILSTDGTGNSGGKGHGTNVWRLHTAIDRQNHLSNNQYIKQVAYYHDGVGSQDKKWLKIIGGAFGYGLKRTIKELYTFLVNNYEPGDKIYLFGFSRGAYTVRLLAGVIIYCGILKKDNYITKSDEDLDEDVEVIYQKFQNFIKIEKYKSLTKESEPSTLIQLIRKVFCNSPFNTTPSTKLESQVYSDIKIKFIGAWDTVDAYAIPSDTLAKLLDKCFYTSFREHDNFLNASVESACHALSIDDQRRTFEPVLWGEKSDSDHHRIKQVWFSGAHSNVGGGYPKQGMAWNTLEWMMLYAKKAGVRFVAEDIGQYSENKDVNDKMYDSRSGLASYYAYKLRDISRLWRDYTSKTTHPQVHISVFERIATRAERYAPRNVPEDLEIIGTNLGEHYKKEDIKALNEQVSQALKDRKSKKTKPDLFEISAEFIHRFSSYYIFFGLLSYWTIGFILFDKSIKTFSLSIGLSIAYCLFIWDISRRYKASKHKDISTFWRTVSSDKTWDFLKR